jgi:hypothetical protein
LIVPDGKLTLAPINAFIDSNGKYLLQRYTLSYVAYDLLGNTAHDGLPSRTTAPVVIADPDFDAVFPGPGAPPATAARPRFDRLPGAKLEAADVMQALHLPPDRVLTGKAAREETIHSLGGPEILHFATHSIPYMDWKVPVASYDLFEFPRSLAMQDPLLQSVILLAGANRPQAGLEDGFLTGLEIASLRLYGTKLVVLSTCEAGQGTPVDGQGVLGLRAAFSMAGAQGLVMSLWPVDDNAGRRFMQFFYSHLAAGPAEAIRQAQLDMVAKTEYQQPRYWAGYSYSGDPSLRIAATAPTKPTTASSESLAQPTCMDVAIAGPQMFRLIISGAVRTSSSSPERVTYELVPPASDLGRWSPQDPNSRPIRPPTIDLAGDHKFPVSLSIERTKEQSAVYIREYVADDDYRYKPQTVVLITLKGAPDLFPGFEIPTVFPPLSSYTEATVSQGSSVLRIDRMSSCSVAN